MLHPRLHSAGVYVIATMIGCEGVSELVKEEVPAVRAFGTLIAMLCHTVAAAEAGTLSNALRDHIDFAIGLPLGVAEDNVVRPGRLPFHAPLLPCRRSTRAETVCERRPE
jgi:hypothetical protein